MKISKWVDMGQEVEVEICAQDIRAALSEAFSVVTCDPLGEEGPNRNDVLIALNGMAAFLNALTEDQIATLLLGQRPIIQAFLLKAAARFAVPPEMA
jgi:hypothetical protein